MRREEVVTERSYNDQDPALVIQAIAVHAEKLAELLGTVRHDQWVRVGVREGTELSVDWMARNVVHEGDHHLVDMDQVLRRVRR
jgi:hypothetical protein